MTKQGRKRGATLTPEGFTKLNVSFENIHFREISDKHLARLAEVDIRDVVRYRSNNKAKSLINYGVIKQAEAKSQEKWTHIMLALSCNVDEATIKRILTDKNYRIGKKTLQELSEVLDIVPAELIGEYECLRLMGEKKEKPWKVVEPLLQNISTEPNSPKRFVKPIFSSPHTNIFLPLIENKLKRFVGREYVINAFEQFTKAEGNDRGYFILKGEPGEGKSTIAARYAKTKDCLFYFNVRGDGQNTASLFLENMCWQLIERYELEKPSSLPPNATQNNIFLKTLLSEASQKVEKIIIVVDAIDEVDLDAQSGYSNVLYLPDNLPKGVYFLLTSRRYVEQLEGRLLFDTPWKSIELKDFAESTADIEKYIRVFLNDPEYRENIYTWMQKQQQSEEELIETLKEKSVRNFLYISLVLPEIANPEGIYKNALLDKLPKGLTAHYNRHWVLMGMNRKPYQIDKLKIICVICQAREPVSCDFLARQSGKILVKVQEMLNGWMQFLKKHKDYQPIRYQFYHESYRDFVFSKDEVKMACGNPKDVDAEIVDNVFGDVSF